MMSRTPHDWFERVQHGNAFEGIALTRWQRLKRVLRALLRGVFS